MSSLALITGASRGIGLATAERFLTEGWDVINLSRSLCAIADVVNYTCDIADSKQLDTVLNRLDLARYECISIVHNAACLQSDDYTTLSEDDFLHVLKLNVVAPQRINQRLLPQLPQGSSVIFIGSTLSEIAAPHLLSYVTSKHALAGMMKALAQDLAGKSIHTCLVCPGFTDTHMLRDSIGTSPSAVERVKQMVLFERLLEPKELASLVYFCSQNPSINGSVLHANLGQR